MRHILKKKITLWGVGLSMVSSTLIGGFFQPVQADTIFGLHGEFQYWNADISGHFAETPGGEDWNWDNDKATRLSLNLNHFVPLVPNVMVEKQKLSTSGALAPTHNFTIGGVDFSDPQLGTIDRLNTNLDLGHDSLTLYYRLFDNSLIQFYFGGTAKKFNGSLDIVGEHGSYSKKIDYTVPMGYLRLTAGLPFTGLSLRAQGQPISFGSHDAYDVEVALRYQLFDTVLLQGVIAAGYRSFNLKLEDKGKLYTDLEMKGPFLNLSIHF